MNEELTVKYVSFTAEDIYSMFPHDKSIALSLVDKLDGIMSVSNVVNALKVGDFMPWPNYVAKAGNSWSTVWGYRGSDGSVFTVNRYYVGCRVTEAVPLRDWLVERGFEPCMESMQDETGQLVHILGWKQEGEYTIVRPTSYPIRGRNVAYIKEGVVHYAKSLKDIKEMNREPTFEERVRAQNAQIVKEAEAERAANKVEPKQGPMFFNN